MAAPEAARFWGLLQRRSGAFGDGSHPTTRLCARAVDYYCRTRAVTALLDVGTGTGILARIGRLRGARFVVGTDLDPAALAAARDNDVLDGSAVPIEWSEAAPDAWGARFDLVVANILEAPLCAMATALRAAVAPHGRLLLSGFTPPQVPSLRRVFGWPGEATSLEGWSLLSLSPA